MKPTVHILNLGAGVQSTTLYLMSLYRDEPEMVPRFDFAIFADTQEEPRAVYDHLEWLIRLNGPPILVRTFGKLGDDLIRGHHQVRRKETAKYRPGEIINQCYSIPAFLTTPDKPAIVRRKCTEAYKINVINRTIREEIVGLSRGERFPVETISVIQYFGLSFDEPSRVAKTGSKNRAYGWFDPRFPLFDLEMTRADCLRYLEKAATGRTIPRSACVFCPYHDNKEWRHIRDSDPEGWARAIAIDEALRSPDAACGNDLHGTQYLHRSCKPLSEAPIDTPESRGDQYLFGFAQECEGMCGL